MFWQLAYGENERERTFGRCSQRSRTVNKNFVRIEDIDEEYQCVVANILAYRLVSGIAFHVHYSSQTAVGFSCVLFAQRVDYGTSIGMMRRHPSRWVDTTKSYDDG